MAETLNLSPGDAVLDLVILSALILVAGAVSGATNFFLTVRSGWSLDTTVWREILIGVIAAITFPLLLSVLSSALISSTRLAMLDYLRLFSLTVCFVFMVRRLWGGLWADPQSRGRSSEFLSLLELEILRSIERKAPLNDELPELPPDLTVTSQKVAMRIRDLLNRGLLGMRNNDQYSSVLFVTATGWSATNKTLNYGADQ